MTDKNLTEIICLVDRSGSMEAVRDDSIGGFNAFLEEQQKSEFGKCLLTYVQFDSQGIDTVHECKPVADVPKLTRDTFVPRGGTPLIDAMCKTIDDTGARLAKLPEDKRPGVIVFMALTDGYENQSRQFTHEELKQRVKQQTDEYKWTFVFLAQNIDAFAAGHHMGMSQSNALHFMGNVPRGMKGARQAYYAASAGVNNLRAKGARGMSAAYSVVDKEEMTKGLVETGEVVLSSTETGNPDESSSTADSSE